MTSSTDIGQDCRSVREMDVTSNATFRRKLDERLFRALEGGRIWNLHATVIVRGDELVFERYFEGQDSERGRSLGVVSFSRDTLHDVRSISKSVVGLLYGLALSAGKVPEPNSLLFDVFPEYSDLRENRNGDTLTIQHVLTMTMGTDWNETSLPYSNPLNSEIAMDLAADRYRFVLERRPLIAPGLRWRYCGGATALLGHIIAHGVGKPLHDFARTALFDPLGIGPTAWLTTADCEPYAASGLRLRPYDLARIGSLMLRNGKHAAKQIIPASWIEQCTSPMVSVDETRRFGYHWYVGDYAFGEPMGWAPQYLERWWGAFGEGGQRLFILPGLDLVVAINSGNYGRTDQRIAAERLLKEIVLPSFVEHMGS